MGDCAALKKSLYALFSQHGQIMDVVALKTVKMRGQAFVVFKDIASATVALRQLQGFDFFDKPMNLQYAKGKSFAVAKNDGSYADLKRKRDEDQLAEKESKKKNQENAPKKPKTEKPKATFGKPFLILFCCDQCTRLTPPVVPAASKSNVDDSALPPNKILFVQNIPEEAGATAQTILTTLFQQYVSLPLLCYSH